MNRSSKALTLSKNTKTNLIILLCSFVVITFACQMPYLQEVTCPLDNLLIESADLPGDQWEEIGSRSYRDAPVRLGTDRIGTSFSTPTNGIVVEGVYSFCSVEETQDGYDELAGEYWFELEPEGTTWTNLDIPDDVSLNAIEYRLECSVRPNQTKRSCWYISRYENVVIGLKADMLIITNVDLFNIIELIDQKVGACNESK